MKPTDFPILTANLEPKDLARFEASLTEYNAAVEAGGMPKSVYDDKIKYGINRAFERAWDKAILDVYTRMGKWEALSEPEKELHWSLNRPECHTASGQLKKVSKLGRTDTPFVKACAAFLEEIEPLALAVKALKDNIQKRQPKTETDPYEKYRAPTASLGAIGLVKARLEEIFETHRQELINNIDHHTTKSLASAIEQSAEVLNMPRGETWKSDEESEIGKAVAWLLSVINTVPSRAWTRTLVPSNVPPGRGHQILYRYTAEPNAAEVIRASAVQSATAMRDAFVFKNLVKFDSIIDKKGNLDRIEIVSHDISLYGLEGTLRVHFKDGSRFDAKNHIVWQTSVNGNEYSRAPLNFTNVILSDGKKMGKPSEQRMNEVFAVAQAVPA